MAVSSISDRQAAPTGEQPAVVTEERLKLFARVIDYNDAGDVDDTENIVIGKLLALGFQIDIDYSQQQPTNACGVVAAVAAARLRQPDWQTADVAFAAVPCTIQRALQHMQPWWPSPLECCPILSSSDVRALYGLEKRRAGSARNAARFHVLPYDKLLKKVHSHVRKRNPRVNICICNTGRSGTLGRHWFTIAYSISKK